MDERYRERYEDTTDMSLQRYFNEQDANTAFQFFVAVFSITILSVVLSIIYVVCKFIV